MSSSLQVAGLASGFDWKNFIDQMMAVEHAPADRLATEKADNSEKVGLLDTLGTRLSTLEDAAKALRTGGVFGLRTVTSSTANSTWKTSATADAPVGPYVIDVTQLATAASRQGHGGIAAPLANSPAGLGDLTVATLPLAQPVTAGTFSVNGQKVSVALTDSLQDVFDAISAATSGTVTASYRLDDKIALTSTTGSLTLGAANDTSNFLSAFKLGNAGIVDATATSAAKLGTLKTTAALANANLGANIAANESGDGSITINGTTITYNVNSDSLSAVLTRINNARVGVNARYDANNDRVLLTNTTTGDLGITASDSTGGLLAALGLTTAATFTAGKDAEFSVNGGETLRSSSNTLAEGAHGIPGLSVTITAEEKQTLTVAADTASMRSKLETFVTKFNDVQQFIDAQTEITTDAKGKVTTAALASNREIQDWGRSLRRLAFGAIGGLRLNDLGLDFKSGSNALEIADGSKLDATLANSDALPAFFETTTTGFSAQVESYLTKIQAQNTGQQERLNAANSSLTDQIAAIERRLTQQRELMESGFLQMERAQSMIKQQQSAIDSMFSSPK